MRSIIIIYGRYTYACNKRKKTDCTYTHRLSTLCLHGEVETLDRHADSRIRFVSLVWPHPFIIHDTRVALTTLLIVT